MDWNNAPPYLLQWSLYPDDFRVHKKMQVFLVVWNVTDSNAFPCGVGLSLCSACWWNHSVSAARDEISSELLFLEKSKKVVCAVLSVLRMWSFCPLAIGKFHVTHPKITEYRHIIYAALILEWRCGERWLLMSYTLCPSSLCISLSGIQYLLCNPGLCHTFAVTGNWYI